MNDEQILEAEFQTLRTDIIERYDQLGMRASSQFERELEVEVDGLTARLTGVHYTEYLVDGRGPGKQPPIQVIEEWIVDKGIANQIEGEITVSSLAYLIARKIGREGTEYFKQGGTDLIDSVITPERIQQIIDKVSVFYIADFTSRFVDLFKELETAA